MSFPTGGNTINYKQIWKDAYQETHYKQPVFRAFADTRFANALPNGASIKWSYDADMDAPALGSDGSYNVEGRTVTDETLTVNQIPAGTFRIPGPQKIQDHRPTMEKWAQKAMNRIFWKVDAQMLGAMQAAALSSVDASDALAGNGSAAGTPITLTVSNAPAIFAAARMRLRNQNIIYDENKKFTGDVKFDATAKYPVAAIPAELEANLLLSIGFKPGDVGDQTLLSGFRDKLFGFNVFYSGALPYTVLLSQTATPTDQDTVIFGGTASTYGTSGGVKFTFVTGTPTNAGDVKASTDAATSMGNLRLALLTPFATGSATTYKEFTRSSGTIYQRQLLDLISAGAVSGTAPAALTVTILGQGSLTTTANGTGMVVSNQAVHAIFGVSQSIALVMQRTPELSMSAGEIISNGSTGGYVARDFVTWALMGWNVFKQMAPQLVDVPIACSTFAAPANTYN